jgi:hypothetical protein
VGNPCMPLSVMLLIVQLNPGDYLVTTSCWLSLYSTGRCWMMKLYKLLI